MSSPEADNPKPIPNYPGYSADTTGNIWRTTPTGQTKRLNPNNQSIPYPVVALTRPDGTRITKAIHRLIGMTYLGIEETNRLQVVRHKDGNTHNNTLANLEAGTAKANQADRKRHTTERDQLKAALQAAIDLLNGAEYTPDRIAALEAGKLHLPNTAM